MGGLRGKILVWIQYYLKDREMRTVIKDITPSWRNVTSTAGVSLSTHNVPDMYK